MIVAKIQVNGAIAKTVYRKVIPAGIIGAQVEFDYDEDIWHGLRKTVVFKGAVTKDVITDANIVTIPHEVVGKPFFRLSIGVYGVDADGNIAIPTLWEDIGAILDAAAPSGDTNTDPSLPVWAQIQAMIGNLDELETTARDNLVAAVNEVAQSGGGGGSASIAMRVYGGYVQYSTDNGNTWVNLIAEADLKGDKGADGKSAYQYAQDGGYTGTEKEFAEKLAAEIPTVDKTLTEQGKAADAKATGDAIRSLSEEKVSLPKDDTGALQNGTYGQILQTNGDGTTQWVDKPGGGGGGGGTTDYTALSNKPQINGVELSDNKTSADLGIGNPTDAQVASAVEAWLYAHPEATTTVADKSITTEKLDDGSVILSKLSESVTNEHYFDPYLRVQYTVGMINADGTIDTSKNFRVTEYLPVVPGETIWLTGGLTEATAYYDKDKNFVSKQTISAGLNPYVVPNGAHYAIYQNIYNGGNVPFFPVRKKGTPKNECFSDLIFSPIKSEVSVGVTGDSNTLGYGLSAGELSWAELLMAEVEKTTSIRVLYHSRFAESFGASLYGGGLNYKTGSQFSVWTDAAHIDLSFSANYDSVFSWYSNDVEIEGSSGLTSMDLNGEFSKITVKFASGQAVNPVFTIPKTITHTNAAVTGVGAGNLTFPEGHDWLLLMVGTNDRNALAKIFLGNKVYSYSGKGTYVVPFPNHKEESINIITQAHRFNEYRNLMRDCGYEVIDCSDVNSWAFYDDTLYRTDRIHFNAKGHRIMCNMISGKMGIPVMLKEN